MLKSRCTAIVKITAILCLISVLFTSCVTGVKTETLDFENPEYITAKYTEDSLHRVNAKKYKAVCSSGLIELLFDKDTATVAIRDKNSKKIWTSLPSDSVSKQISSSALEIMLSNGDNRVYTLNSQDNSVAFGNFTYTASADGVSVTYSMALDKETGKAEIGSLKEGTIRADITILYTLKDGSFYTNVSMNKLTVPEGVFVERIAVLNSFGAYEKGDKEDYIFIPDGSGALIMTGVEDKDFSPVSIPVYGENPAVSSKISTSSCLLGAFGMKSLDNAFLCIIEAGDTIARINATRNTNNTLNSAYASFDITDTYTDESEKIYGSKYENEITLCYRFLSGKSATYSGMATACRENLIRNSVLSTKSVDTSSNHIPLIVSVQGGYRNEKNKYAVLSDYEQTLSLVTLLKAKGVNNLYLRYNGLYNAANNGSNEAFDSFESKLGNEIKYRELYEYLNSQKFMLFIDTDILTYSSESSGALNIDGKQIRDEATADYPAPVKKQSFLKMSKLENKVEDILKSSEDVLFDGYALNDLGAYLYTDYSLDSYSRSLCASELSSQIPVLATSKMLMIDTGNFYSLRNADVISKIPTSCIAHTESDAYVSIPFVQMLLHGISEYSGQALNTYDDTETAFLRCVEYGCLPSADWYCTSLDEKTDNKYYFDKNINDIVNYYTKSDTALSGLRDARMTSHYKLQNGVYCTEYDNSIKVYVNYTKEDVTVNGVIINARDCVTIS